MSDQADKLRQLFHAVAPTSRPEPVGPPMILVTGGRTGVGVTTVAVNLAAVLADRGQRALLLDAAEQRAKGMEYAGAAKEDVRHTLADLLAGKCAIADAIESGPCGMMLLAEREREFRRNSPSCDFSRRGQERLLAGLASLQDDVDLIVVDAGSGLTAWTRRFWLRAALVLLVTTADAQPVMDAYAMLKLSVADGLGPDVRLLVNQCDNESMAADVQRRFNSACRRFLGRSVPALPSLPRHVCEESRSRHTIPRVWEAPNTPFGHATLWLAQALSEAPSSSAQLASSAA